MIFLAVAWPGRAFCIEQEVIRLDRLNYPEDHPKRTKILQTTILSDQFGVIGEMTTNFDKGRTSYRKGYTMESPPITNEKLKELDAAMRTVVPVLRSRFSLFSKFGRPEISPTTVIDGTPYSVVFFSSPADPYLTTESTFIGGSGGFYPKGPYVDSHVYTKMVLVVWKESGPQVIREVTLFPSLDYRVYGVQYHNIQDMLTEYAFYQLNHYHHHHYWFHYPYPRREGFGCRASLKYFLLKKLKGPLAG